MRAGLEGEGVDVSELALVPGARSPQSSILVTGEERAIVHFPGTVPPLAPTGRAQELMHAAEWVHADHAGYAAVPEGARLSLDGGNPVPGLDLGRVELYSPTETALSRDVGSAEDALAAGARLVVVTRGAQGCSAWTSEGRVDAVPAPLDTPPVSTLGAGDVFHGALLAGLVGGRDLAGALALANRCAALSCRALDGRSAIPTLQEVE